MTVKMNAAELTAFMHEEFEQMAGDLRVAEPDENGLTVTLATDDRHLRPGGTVSGPTLFALADVAFYLLILSRVGPKALTVTSNANINFMRRAEPGPIHGHARILKLGRRLVMGDVVIGGAAGADASKPIAHASLTYSLPPRTGAG